MSGNKIIENQNVRLEKSVSKLCWNFDLYPNSKKILWCDLLRKRQKKAFFFFFFHAIKWHEFINRIYPLSYTISKLIFIQIKMEHKYNKILL